MDEARKLLPKSKTLVGIACSPAAEQELRKQCETSFSTNSREHLGYGNCFYGAPIIVDSRLGKYAEAYYCPKLWKERVKEQNKFDIIHFLKYNPHMNIRQKALGYAELYHFGQTRKDGKPYISHPVAVAEIAEQIAKSRGITEQKFLDDLYVLAIFHDAIEESSNPETTKAEIREEFGDYYANSLEYLTRVEGQTYLHYIVKIKGHYDPLVEIVKVADLRHNMSDLKEGSLKDKYRLAEYLLLLETHE